MRSAPVTLATAAMGTRFELALLEGRGDLRAAGEAALDEIELWHRRLSRFAADSLLSHITRTAGCRAVRLDGDTYALFDDALRVWHASERAFDITVAPLMDADARELAGSSVPAGSGHVDAGAIELDGDQWSIRFTQPRVGLDLGGIAKGHALDCASAVLRNAGVTAALVHGGTSSIVAVGCPPGTSGWPVALGAEPNAPVVRLCDAAMSVSDGSIRRAGATGSGHILDPRDRRSPAGSARAAVIGPSARLADAWSTALVVLQRVPAGFPTRFQALIGFGSSPLVHSTANEASGTTDMGGGECSEACGIRMRARSSADGAGVWSGTTADRVVG